MPDLSTVSEVVEKVTSGAEGARERAVVLHDFVRDRIKFGFNRYFDAAEPDQTLACGVGHCNPKSRLLVGLFRSAGLEAYQHFVVVPKEILKGALPASRYWMIPAEVSHSFVEVRVEGEWRRIDSHIVDTPLLRAAQARLAREGRSLGYGVRVDSTNVWDGRTDAFSQFDETMLIEDHGRVEDIDAYFRSARYRGKALGLRFNTMFQWMGDAGVKPMNAHIDRIRQG
jgi:transglutaminase-like putative cysteine protease